MVPYGADQARPGGTSPGHDRFDGGQTGPRQAGSRPAGARPAEPARLLGPTLLDCADSELTGVLQVLGDPGGVIFFAHGLITAIATPGAPGPERLLAATGRTPPRRTASPAQDSIRKLATRPHQTAGPAAADTHRPTDSQRPAPQPTTGASHEQSGKGGGQSQDSVPAGQPSPRPGEDSSPEGHSQQEASEDPGSSQAQRPGTQTGLSHGAGDGERNQQAPGQEPGAGSAQPRGAETGSDAGDDERDQQTADQELGAGPAQRPGSGLDSRPGDGQKTKSGLPRRPARVPAAGRGPGNGPGTAASPGPSLFVPATPGPGQGTGAPAAREPAAGAGRAGAGVAWRAVAGRAGATKAGSRVAGAGELEALLRLALADGMFAIAAGSIDGYHLADPPGGAPLPLAGGVPAGELLGEATRRLEMLDSLASPISPDRDLIVYVQGGPSSGVVPGPGQREILALANGRRTPRDIAFALGRGVYAVTLEIDRMRGAGLVLIDPGTVRVPPYLGLAGAAGDPCPPPVPGQNGQTRRRRGNAPGPAPAPPPAPVQPDRNALMRLLRAGVAIRRQTRD